MEEIYRTPELNTRGYYVRVSEDALIQMVLASLEAYTIQHDGPGKRSRMRNGTPHVETYGQVWGHTLELPHGETLIQVDSMTLDSSAVRQADQVLPDSDALRLKHDVLTSFWPHRAFLGDFHSHPYGHFTEVEQNEGWSFSKPDWESLTDAPDEWLRLGYQVGFVMAIGHLKRASQQSPDWRAADDLACVQFTLGNLRLWLRAHVACRRGDAIVEATGDGTANFVILECPTLMGWTGEYSRFGRARQDVGFRFEPGD